MAATNAKSRAMNFKLLLLVLPPMSQIGYITTKIRRPPPLDPNSTGPYDRPPWPTDEDVVANWSRPIGSDIMLYNPNITTDESKGEQLPEPYESAEGHVHTDSKGRRFRLEFQNRINSTHGLQSRCFRPVCSDPTTNCVTQPQFANGKTRPDTAAEQVCKQHKATPGEEPYTVTCVKARIVHHQYTLHEAAHNRNHSTSQISAVEEEKQKTTNIATSLTLSRQLHEAYGDSQHLAYQRLSHFLLGWLGCYAFHKSIHIPPVASVIGLVFWTPFFLLFIVLAQYRHAQQYGWTLTSSSGTGNDYLVSYASRCFALAFVSLLIHCYCGSP